MQSSAQPAIQQFQVPEGNEKRKVNEGGETHVWLSPFGLNIHAASDATTTTIRPISRLHL